MVKASKILLAVAMTAALAVTAARASAAEKGFSSVVGSFGSSIKSGFSKVSKAVSPKPKSSGRTISDATSLLVKAKPSAKLYVAVAQAHVSNGNLQDAHDMYQRALKITPDYADALTGLALLKDRRGAYGEAVILYEKAANAHPNNAAVFNGMGLCHATHDNFKLALSALERAVQMEPRELKYRNNIAMVLVEMGRYDEAFSHFRAQYDDPVAHYNLAYLLQKRGDNQKALEHFAAAIEKNPRFEEARTWFEHLAGHQPPRQPAHQTAQVPMQIGMEKSAPAAQTARPRIGSSDTPLAQASREQTRRFRKIEELASKSSDDRINVPRAWSSQYQQPAAAPDVSQPAIAQNAMQRTWATPPRRPIVQSQPQPRQQQQPLPKQQATSRRQLDALAPLTTIQRLPPVEQSFESTPAKPRQLSPPPSVPLPPKPAAERVVGLKAVAAKAPAAKATVSQGPVSQMPVQKASAPLAPLPPAPASRLPVRSGTLNTPAASYQAAPLPGSAMPTAPPAAGTTRTPMVYPLPPVNEYRQ